MDDRLQEVNAQIGMIIFIGLLALRKPSRNVPDLCRTPGKCPGDGREVRPLSEPVLSSRYPVHDVEDQYDDEYDDAFPTLPEWSLLDPSMDGSEERRPKPNQSENDADILRVNPYGRILSLKHQKTLQREEMWETLTDLQRESCKCRYIALPASEYF
ncbi:MAG: hypothetical protein M1837_003400 [Sclerophora amabilis]|nr:MAG: hypothetical protein M1837_003400 [Sclerophora amabilis]